MRSPSVSLVLVFVLVVSVGGVLFGCEGTPDTPDTGTANTPNANFQALAPLTVADVQTIIAQAVTQAVASNVQATIAVADRGGNVLGVFQMTNAPLTTLIGSSSSPNCAEGVAQPSICGLEGQRVPSLLWRQFPRLVPGPSYRPTGTPSQRVQPVTSSRNTARWA